MEVHNYLVQFNPNNNKFRIVANLIEPIELSDEETSFGFMILSASDLKKIDKNNIVVTRNVTIY